MAWMIESNTTKFGHMFKIDSIFIIPYPQRVIAKT